MKKRYFLIGYKIFFAGLVAAAVTYQLYRGFQKDSFSTANFFSFFTIQSNLFGAVVFLMSADLLFWKRKRNHEEEMLRGAATLYMVTTGIIYALLLSRADVQTPVLWVNAVLHYVFPLVMLTDWLYDKPGHKIIAKQSLLWLIYPLVYAIYSLVRGPLVNHWYPYPFLDPAQHGYAAVLFSCVAVGIIVVVISQVVLRLPKWVTPPRR